MITKKSQTKYWKNKSLGQIKSYIESPVAIRRSKWFTEHLKGYEFSSICEAGMFSGRNCYYISQSFPMVSIHGFDINKKAVEFAKQNVKNVDFWEMDIHDMRNMNKSFDIIFTSGTLIHIVPDEIVEVLSGFVMKADKYIMHIEECGNGELVKGPKHLSPKKRASDQCQWSHDLVSVYKDIGLDVEVVPLLEDIRTNGAKELLIIEV